MFTGLIVETGEFLALERRGESARLTLRAPGVAADAPLGDSIAVNGCCLTVVENTGGVLAFDLLAETLRLTSLGDLAPGAAVNLEPALGAAGKLGGHLVQGHVDTAAPILALEPRGPDHGLEIALPAEFARLIVHKGSVTVDGISLTVAEVRPASFVIWIIPHTFAVTNLRHRHAGDRVNLEFDVIAKYVDRMLAARGL
jgi:riboflavin synthase